MISCSLSPNTEADDVWLALRLLCAPWKWKRGNAVHRVEQRLCGISFNSGRSALLAILKAFDIGKGDEVIVQAFTCVAVPNSVRWAGATPVFADIDKTYNMDLNDFAHKLTKKTKAVVVQHTFGIPAKIDEILAIAKKHNIRVIEDFAHTMSLPLRGDAGFYSFGRDKVLSSVFGGLATISEKWEVQSEKLKTYHKTLNMPSMFWIFQQLLHPIAFSIILHLYRLGVGKAILVILQRLRLLSFPQISDVAKYPNALAILLLKQLKKLERYTKQREDIVRLYGGTGSLLRYPMRVDEPEKIIAKAKKQGVLLGNWYHHVIDPVPVAYKPGSCPRAEDAAKHIINLPTRISACEAKRVLDVLEIKAQL